MKAHSVRRGHTAVDVLVALLVVAAVAAMAVPMYRGESEEARAARCTVNREAIETAERACALEHQRPCLNVERLVKDGYLHVAATCPSHGTYVWAAKEPGDPAYPSLGCSKHHWPGHTDAPQASGPPAPAASDGT